MDLKDFPLTLSFFDNNEFAASTFLNKYALKDTEGNILEDDPHQTIQRVMKALGDMMPDGDQAKTAIKRILKKDYNEEDYNKQNAYMHFFIQVCDSFRGVCPQGSILSGAGSFEFLLSLSNCFVIPAPLDSMSGIHRTAEQESQLMKRRGGVGFDISTLRPKDHLVRNAAATSSGAVGWMEHFSNVCRAVGQCLHPTTLVMTDRGMVEIQNINIGDSVWTQNKWAKVLNKIKNHKKTYKLTTKYGREIIASADHVLLSDNKELRISELKPGDKITAIYGSGWTADRKELNIETYKRSNYNNSNRLRTNISLPRYLNEELAYLLGQSYGDGYVCLHHTSKVESGLEIALSNDYPDIKKKLKKIVKSVFNYESKLTKADGNCETFILMSREIIEFLKQNDLLKQKAADLVFPSSLLSSGPEILMSFIAGFFDADGSVSQGKKSYKINSINKKFLQTIQSCLLANGVISKLHKTDRSSLGWNDLFTLTINGEKSQNIFRKLMKESIKIQNAEKWTSKLRDFTRTIFDIRDFGSCSSRHSYIIDNEQKITYSTLGRLSIDLNFKSEDFNLLEDQIVSIVPHQENEEVYDISLDHTHFFFANGLYVHNSGRRGALMLSIHIKHPDAKYFSCIKRDLSKVTGANISVRLSDEFMEAVYEGKDFVQQWPIDSENPQVRVVTNARELWSDIIGDAWASGEPGLMFWDNCTKNLPAHCYPSFKAVSTNPCGEVILSEYDSCRLVTICLTKFVDFPFKKSACFNFERFETHVRAAMRMMDAVVSAEIKHIEAIIEKVKKDQTNDLPQNRPSYDLEIDLWTKIKESAVNGRRTGLGTHGLGDTLAQLGLRYDSDEAIAMVDNIYSSLRNFAYDESVELAKEFGPFPVYDYEKELECEFIQRLPKSLREKMKKYGRRNISILTNAPTGTISILSMCSSGIEPTFRQKYTRRRKINQNDKNARIDFTDQSGDQWTEFSIFEKNVERYFKGIGKDIPELMSDSELDALLPDYFVTSDKISWKKRVEIQAAAQKYIDHSISSTINLPNSATIEDVAEVYEHAHKMGLKGVTVYRDGCRTGVLVSMETHQKQKQSGRPETIIRQESPKRPKSLPCEVHISVVDGVEYVIIVGFLGDSIYEVFAGEHNNQLPEKKFSGHVIKKNSTEYLLKYTDKDEEKEVNINKYFKNPNHAAVTRLVSTALRHGTPVSFVSEQLLKSSEAFTGFEKSLARVLKKYAKKEDMARKILSDAGEDDIEIKFEDGCMIVINHTKNTVESKCD